VSRDEGRGGSRDPYLDLEGTLHEVSNALTVLLGWVAEARAPGASMDEIRHALAIVDQRARRARDLARRAIGAKIIPADSDADLAQVLGDVAATLAVEAQRANVKVTLEPSEPARIVLGEDVAQIVTNLVLNAIAHAPPHTEIRIVMTTHREDVWIDVIDAGPGVPEARQESVFEGDTKREGGAGVGLRHARAIARAAGGDLSLVESTQGARFRLVWPRADVRRKPVASLRPSGEHLALSLAGSRILVVEDDADVTDLLEAGLGARGAVVTIARTAAELDKALYAEPPDAVLLDLSPIAADPSASLARLKTAAPNAAVVFVSGSNDRVPEGIAEGTQFVRKPFELSEIVGALVRARRS
jgi:CheY-like chemotaxis protein